MTHLNDEQVAACVDDEAAADAAHLAHLAQCAVCQQQVTALRAVAERLRAGPSQPSVVDDVWRVLERPPWWKRWQLPSLAAASCAAVVAAAVWQAPPTTLPTTLTPRGGHHDPGVLQLRNDDRAVVDGTDVDSASSWRADLNVDSVDGAIAVVAVDVRGDVHWLRPTWTDAAQPPSCPPLNAPAVAPQTVAFSLPAGPLTLRALLLPQPCDVQRLDAALSAGALGGAVVVDEVHLVVRP